MSPRKKAPADPLLRKATYGCALVLGRCKNK